MSNTRWLLPVLLIGLFFSSESYAQDNDVPVDDHDHAEEWSPIFTHEIWDLCKLRDEPVDPTVIRIGSSEREFDPAANPPRKVVPKPCEWFVLAVIDEIYLGGSNETTDPYCFMHFYNRGGPDDWVMAAARYIEEHAEGSVPGDPAIWTIRRAINEYLDSSPDCEGLPRPK